jgi:hypothetical protein
MAGNTAVLGLLATIGCGIQGALNSRLYSFAQFYFITGSFSSSVYLLFTPDLHHKINSISKYRDPSSGDAGSNDPKRDIRKLLRVHGIRSVFAGIGLLCF